MQELPVTLMNMLTFTFASLFSMVNPIGMAPVFLEKTKAYPLARRRSLAYKVGAYGTLLLTTTLLAGPYVLQFFGISLADIQIAGGIFVFYSAWQMLTAPPGPASDDQANNERAASDIAFFPLTMPLTAGAGSIAVVLSLSSNIVHSGGNLAVGYVGAIAGICLVFVAVAVSYRFADQVFSRIGTVGTGVITRLTAFLLLAIGVAVTWGGLRQLLLSLHS
jgi:multiple antibiotic resistance protein